jgi:hypothetical protein
MVFILLNVIETRAQRTMELVVAEEGIQHIRSRRTRIRLKIIYLITSEIISTLWLYAI